MSVRTGTVRPDGSSTLLPKGVYDMAAASDQPLEAAVEERIAELVKGLNQRESAARFRIEVFFRGGPRKTVPVRGVVAVWTNGGYLHGGGDAAVYLCPQVVDTHPCMAPIDMQFVTSRPSAREPDKMEQVVVCTACRRLTVTTDLIGQLLYEVPTQRWAQILVQLFHLLDCSADLSISIERESLHKAAEQELASYRGGECYARVAQKRECVVYPLAHILADTASGAGLEERFRAFLEA